MELGEIMTGIQAKLRAMGSELDRSKLAVGRFLREGFPGAYKAYQETYGKIVYEFLAFGPVLRALSLRRFKRCERSSRHPYEVVTRYKGFGPYRSIKAVQHESEIIHLFDLVMKAKPTIICEIGTDMGGTLYLWSKVIPFNGLVISVDLPRTYRKSLNRFFELGFFWNKKQVTFLRENSQSSECRDKVLKILDGRSVDFLFIDADHSYEGVKRDFELYSPLVKQSGIIALHDILDNGVDRFWLELKTKYDCFEIIQNPAQIGFGIGVLGKEPRSG